jgi:hypothetical protein
VGLIDGQNRSDGELKKVVAMNTSAGSVNANSHVSQILKGLEMLPPEKVAVVSDFVHFLRTQYETETPAANGDLASFDREVATFDALDPQLQEQYAGRAVAIYQGQVVADGDSKLAVLDAVLTRFGQVPCYVDWVKPSGPRRVRVPSVWIAK